MRLRSLSKQMGALLARHLRTAHHAADCGLVLWDGPARAQAERLAQAWPDWLVLYGVGSRRFYALAAWPTLEPLMVDATTSEELEARRHEAETTAITHPEPPVPTPGTRRPAPTSNPFPLPRQTTRPPEQLSFERVSSPKQARRQFPFPGTRRRAIPAQTPPRNHHPPQGPTYATGLPLALTTR